MDLLNLAPDIQEHILHLPRPGAGQAPISERRLRQALREIDWEKQREAWGVMIGPLTAAVSPDSNGGCCSIRQLTKHSGRGIYVTSGD